jgi:hypothetical protein
MNFENNELRLVFQTRGPKVQKIDVSVICTWGVYLSSDFDGFFNESLSENNSRKDKYSNTVFRANDCFQHSTVSSKILYRNLSTCCGRIMLRSV